MCRVILSCLCMALSYAATSQNLFVNQGFEEINWCAEYNVPCAPVGWFNIMPADIPKVDGKFIPKALLGKQVWPVPVENINNAGARGFVYTMLKCPLRKGAKYKISFYLNTGRIKFYHIDFSFSAYEPLYNDSSNESTNIRFDQNNVVADMRMGWKAVEAEFTASGNEQFCLIGNLVTAPLPFTEKEIMNRNGNVFYFIDEVMLRPLDGGLCKDADSTIKLITQKTSRHTENIFIKEKFLPKVIQDTVVLPSIYFRTNEWEPVDEFKNSIDSIARLIFSKDYSRIEIIGHTDNIGSKAYNLELSLKRATAIREILVRKKPQAAALIFALGRGAHQPVAENKSETGRALNRRVEIIITRKLNTENR